jgi:hypothetical protein
MMFNQNLISYFVRLAVLEEVGNTLGHYHSAPWLLRYTFIQAELYYFFFPFTAQVSNSSLFYLLGMLLINIKQAYSTVTIKNQKINIRLRLYPKQAK